MKKQFNKIQAGILASILLVAVVSSVSFAAAQQPPENPGNSGAKGNITDCVGLLDGGEFDSIRIQDGRSCHIIAESDAVLIHNDVTVGQGSMLTINTLGAAPNTITIEGDVKSDGGLSVRIMGVPDNLVVIGGSVQITNTEEGITVSYADIGENSQFDNNLGYYSIVNSIIDGNVQIEDNSGTGSVGLFNNVAGNDISGNLQCSGNDPAPTVAFGFDLNSALNAQGQCEALV